MVDLDIKILEKAKDQFYQDFKGEIENLGYFLCHGITTKNDSLAISAMIQNTESEKFPKNKKKYIENLIPQTYPYKKHKIPVQLSYIGPVTAL